MSVRGCCGILLVNTGTPAKPNPHEVRKYLSQFLMDRHIVPMNPALWWVILHLFVLPQRGRASAAKYEKIWTEDGSPFALAHENLESRLNELLRQEHIPAMVRCAMNYGEPSVCRCLQEMKDAECTHVVVLPLYPQSAYSTTGSVCDTVARAFKRIHWDVAYDIIDNYHENTAYISAIVHSIKDAGFNVDSDDVILFSYHSIPFVDINAGDTYPEQVKISSAQIAQELGIDRFRWTIGFHSRFDKEREWLSPFTHDIIMRWAQGGGKRVFLLCPNFAVDCLETLYDITYELEPLYLDYANVAERVSGKDNFVYVPCLNATDTHCRVLLSVLQPYIEG